MAHYLAELMSRASQERNTSKRKKMEASCSAIIERLWMNRANLPGGAKPLGRIEPQLAAIEAMMADFVTTPAEYRHAAKDTTDPWLIFAIASHAIDRRMAAIALLTSFLETDFGREKRWVKENSLQLSKQERELIDSLDGWLGTKHDFFTSSTQESIADLPAAKRNAMILAELKKALQAQQTAYKTLKKPLQSPRDDSDD